MVEVRENNGEYWALFSTVLDAVGGLDPKTAGIMCDEAGIERTTLPNEDARKKYIRLADISRFLALYSRLNPDKIAAKQTLLAWIAANYPGIILDDYPLEPDKTPPIPIPNPDKTPPSPPLKPDKKPGNKAGITGESNWKRWGDAWGNFYASSFTSFFALTVLVLVQAYLHGDAASNVLPKISPIGLHGLALLIQTVVLIGTVNSGVFTDNDRQYAAFLAGFAVYDIVMGGCNFFYDYPGFPAYWTFTDACSLGIRLGLTLGFPLATIFFAALVKKIRR